MSRRNITKDVLFQSFVITLSVFISELAAGLVAGSLAIVSDAIHASIDLSAALMLLIAGRISLKPADENHTYGHGKVDAVGGFLGAIILLVMSLFVFYQVTIRWSDPGYAPTIDLVSYVVLAYVLCSELVKACILSRKLERTVVKVGSIHNLVDTGGTIVAIASSMAVNLGYPRADLLASVALGTSMLLVGLKTVQATALELTDAVPRAEARRLKSSFKGVTGYEGLRDLRMRKAGNLYFLEVTVLVRADTTLQEAHDVSESVERAVKSTLGDDVVCTVHVEPLSRGGDFKEAIENSARSVRGVRDVHSVRFGTSEGVTHITLHARMAARMTIQEAHDVANEIERRLSADFMNASVLVHLEPDNRFPHVERTQSGMEVIAKAAMRVEGVAQVPRVEWYELQGRRCLDVHVTVNRDMTVEEAHRIASSAKELITSEVGRDVSIEVHVEPT